MLVWLILSLHPAGCVSEGGKGPWSRAGVDLFVVASSPIQVPVMAARDGWSVSASSSRALFPLCFVVELVKHGGLTLLHAVDFVATPLHLVRDADPVQIYVTESFPMQTRERDQVVEESKEAALFGAAFLGGLGVAYYFFAVYVPGLFEFWF